MRTYVERENFQGYDPYDALNSTILRKLSFNRKALRIAFIQFMKRFPINLRPLLGIRKEHNPKGIGLFLWSYAKLYKATRNLELLQKIDFFLDLLESLKSQGYSGNCWGYNFDWQSKAFFLPKFTPTIVNSAFIGHALLDTYQFVGKERALEMALPISQFILQDLNKKEDARGICFSYSPLDETFVHNANLLGASLLIRLYRFVPKDELKDIALASLAYSMSYQRDDGSWYYAETDYQRWIDSFHTGFNLQSILYFLEEGFGLEDKSAFEKGVKFYAESFFLDYGAPKYYHDRLYPMDIHSASQGLVLFSRIKGYEKLRQKIARWMLENMQDKRGFFYYLKNRFYTNKIPYMRWSQAWALHALTDYFISEGRKEC
ncbi:MAG: delta-aminolevulinic acid dehydratase [Candidatus Jordarchaeum sp.]